MAEKRKFKKRYCKYCAEKVEFIDYKDVDSYKHSLSERYKIMPRRLTGNCKRHQDMVADAIKKARQIALVPYVVDRKSVVLTSYEPYDKK
jgi:small subunit ribosomal protein S18